MNHLDGLPVEILEIIFFHCDKSTIKTLSLSSLHLHKLAIQHLYRLILPADARQTILLFWSLVQVPLVAGYIRTLHVRAPFCLARDVFKIPAEMEIGHYVNSPGWDGKMDYWIKKAAQSASIQREGTPITAHSNSDEQQFFDFTMMNSLPVIFIEQAFRNMTSLQTLVIHTPSHPHMWAFSCELPTLKHVTIHKHADSSLLICWLAKQPALTSLQYSPGIHYLDTWFPAEGLEVEAHFLPNLREVSTSPVGVVLLVPGRPVDSLHVNIFKEDRFVDEGIDDEAERRERLSRKCSRKNFVWALRASTVSIKNLTISAANATNLKPFLQVMLRSLSSITRLCIRMDYDASLDSMLEEDLGSLSNLLILEVPSNHQRRIPNVSTQENVLVVNDSREEQIVKVTRWARLAPVLHTVVLHPESPLMASLARNSVAHGTIRYEVLIFRWEIHRGADGLEVVAVE